MSGPDDTQQLPEQPKSLAPKRKVTAGLLAGSLSTIVMWVLSANGITAPPGIESAITTIFSFLVAYIVPEE
jgi:hypothetical protein